MKRFVFLIILPLLAIEFIPAEMHAAKDYDELNRIIQESGGKWRAGETKFSHMTIEQRKAYMGLIWPSKRREEVTVWPFMKNGDPPAALDWRDNNGNWVTSVKDQGPCGSCWAFGAVGHLESVLKILSGDPGYPVDLSEQYLVSCCTENWGCSGGDSENTYNFLESDGIPLESCFPYVAEEPPCSNACSYAERTAFLIEQYGWITYGNLNMEDLKNAILLQPLFVTFLVYEDFLDYVEGVYRHTYGDEPLAGHAVMLVGWDDDEQCWIVKNSWGHDWGENGYFRIAYDDPDCYLGYYTIAAEFSGDAKALFESDRASGYVPLSVPFTDVSSSSENIVEWHWDFGNGHTSQEQHPVAEFTTSGIFSVSLTVKTESEASDTLVLENYIEALEGSPTRRYVPSQYSTIQAALTASQDGDTILIADGVYSGSENRDLDPMGKELLIKGENGPENCRIDCQSQGRAFYIRSGEDEDMVIEGLTISNGKTITGAGIFIANSSPVLRNLIISNNSARDYWGSGDGGAILVLNASPVIEDVVITDNEAAGLGGGMYLSSADPVMRNVVIEENSASQGGGLYLKNSSFPILEDVEIRNNSASDQGGGMYCNRKSYPTFLRATIAHNSAEYEGGGVYFYDGSACMMTNTVVYRNTASEGGGIYCYNNSYPLILNSVYYGNVALNAGGAIYASFCCGPEIANSILWGDFPEEICFSPVNDRNFIAIAHSNVEGDTTDIESNNNGDIYWLDGNISEEPRFADPDNMDFHLKFNSPCIDEGIQDTLFVYGDSDTLLIPEMEYLGSNPDMGAFEGDYVNITDEESRPTVPTNPGKFDIMNSPNPFNPVTVIHYDVPECCTVRIKIYDLAGRVVKSFPCGRQEPGRYRVIWDGRNQNGNPVSSGVYVCALSVKDHTLHRKMLLLK
jgi:PKD repeat protein